MKKSVVLFLVLILLASTCLAEDEVVIFSYSYSVMFSPTPYSFSIILYKDGHIEKEIQTLDIKTSVRDIKKEEYKIDPEYVNDILQIIKEANINDIPHYLPHYVEDMPGSRFNFNGKEIYGEGVSYMNPFEMFIQTGNITWLKAATYYNRVLDLNNNIKKVFESAGYNFERYDFTPLED
ncbi:MAG: hypothetical protein GYA87_04840 [Christensenellaceae bacterium]|nr:hypothetical protein [Christensenellaceae bacterium]